MKGLSNETKPVTAGGLILNDRYYENIVENYIDTIYRIAVSYTKTPADADDVVQQTFMKLLSRKREFTDEEHVKRWLIRVCVNECNSMFSSFWRKHISSYDEVTADTNQSELDDLSNKLEFKVVENLTLYEAIKELPAKFKAVIYLFYYEGYPTVEIAKILRIKEATVRSRLVTARKALKSKLKEAWEDE